MRALAPFPARTWLCMPWRSVGYAAVACIGITWIAVAPSNARAWTEANVETARVHAEVGPDGAALVAMAVTLRIHGGWLEGLDIDGLDPDLTLDETKPPWAVSLDDDLKFEPRVSVQGGRVSFSFRGHGRSPRRGRVELGFVYRTSLGERQTQPLEDSVRVRFTLPGWQSGLDGVLVAITAPPGSVAADVAPTGAVVSEGGPGSGSIRVREIALERATIVTWERPHLPRTVPWTVAVDVPNEAMDPALRAPPTPERPKAATGGHDATDDPIPVAIVLAVLVLLSLASRFRFEAECRARAALARPLVPMPPGFAVVAGLGLGAAAVHLWGSTPLLGGAAACAVCALSLQRTPSPLPEGSRRGTWRAVRRGDAPRRSTIRRWLAGATLFDATTLAGAAALSSIIFSTVVLVPLSFDDQPMLFMTVLLAAAPFLSGTRQRLPPSMAERLDRLRRTARALRTGEQRWALSLAVLADGRPTAARLEVIGAELPPGTHVQIHLAHERELDGVHLVPTLVVAHGDDALDLPGFDRLTGLDGRFAFARPLGSDPSEQLQATLSTLRPQPVAEPARDLAA